MLGRAGLTRLRGRFSPSGDSPLGLRLWDHRVILRVILGTLLVANIVAALLVFKPWGGSEADLSAQIQQVRKDAQARRQNIERLRVIAEKVERGRKEGDGFVKANFLDSRTAFSTIVAELTSCAKQAKMRDRGYSYAVQPVEGADTLTMMTVAWNYEGTFADLMAFVNLLDRSERFLILDSLQAAPLQTGLQLSMSIKLNVFVKEGTEKL